MMLRNTPQLLRNIPSVARYVALPFPAYAYAYAYAFPLPGKETYVGDVPQGVDSSSIRFWGKVAIGEPFECWEWVGSIGSRGYGSFRDGKRVRSAHRVAYELAVCALPSTVWVDHLCHNRKCVNPNHLRVCTPSQNSQNRLIQGNNGTGLKGVYKSGSRWRACINRVHLGSFSSPEEAHAAYTDAAKSLFGEFACDGHQGTQAGGAL